LTLRKFFSGLNSQRNDRRFRRFIGHQKISKSGNVRAQAEVQVAALADALGSFVTKEDLRATELRLENRIDEVETRLENKIEKVETDLAGRIEKLEMCLTIRLGGMLVVAIGMVAALVKML